VADLVELSVSGMTCMGCAGNVQRALEALDVVESAEVTLDPGLARVSLGDGGGRGELVAAVVAAGYGVEGEGDPQTAASPATGGDFHWSDKGLWKQSAHNTKWCLIGCSIGEFGTLAAYSIFGVGAAVATGSGLYYLLLLLPLINGLITSVMLETAILVRGQMDLGSAVRTALGMSFISMLMMEIAMEITDLVFTGGVLGMNPVAIPFMLLVGFLTPWPYNYWRLKKYGMSCH